ncbi:MAG: hypothetical protein HYY06_32990 [Deltaproteobacteria bacterium]|nr:hypothetical protein [Deltaproteobacteria bacterium]
MRVAASIALFLASAGCADDTAAPCADPEPTLAGLRADLFERSCTVSSSCHRGSSPEPTFGGPDDGIDLEDPEGPCDLIDRPAITDERGRPLITCGSCADSYVAVKVDPALAAEITTSSEYAARYPGIDATAMPQRKRGEAAAPLCESEIQALCAWIDDGCQGCP